MSCLRFAELFAKSRSRKRICRTPVTKRFASPLASLRLECLEERWLLTSILGSAESFAVLGASTVTSTGLTNITGNLGVSPGSAVTGFPPGVVTGGTIHAGDAVATQAHGDLATAYKDLAGMPLNSNLTGQGLGGLTLGPGVYHFNTSAELAGTLTLNAQGHNNAFWVFQIGSTLTTASNSVVQVINFGSNGGTDDGLFWQVGSSATLGTGTMFEGNIVAFTSITLDTGATIPNGRAITLNGAVTMGANVISIVGPNGGPGYSGNWPPASQAVFTTQPTNTAAGHSIVPAVQVTLENSSGTTATTDDSDVTLALGTNPSGGVLGGTLTVAAVNGVATFRNLSINNVGMGYSLTAADGSLSGAASDSFNITADRVTPTITWNTPAAIIYGTALSNTQLDATASVPGRFKYATVVGTVLNADSGQTLSVTFTPTDTAGYTTATQTTTITVNKATPIIRWPTPAPIVQGTALSNTQLDARDSWTVGGTLGRVAGQFVYSPKARTVLPAGNQTLSATFTPTDLTDYTTATAGTTVAVVGPFSLSQSTITLSPSSIASGAKTTVTLTVRDANGNQELGGGLTVKFALGSGISGGTFGTVKDNKNGTYTATFTATIADGNTITAIVGGNPVTATAPLIVVPGAVSLSKSTVTLTQSGVPVRSMASGATATLTLMARDANGNQEDGLAAVFGLAKKAGSGSAGGTFSTVTDNGDGTYTTTFTATTAGTNTITATIGGKRITSPLPTVTVTTVAAGIAATPSLDAASTNRRAIDAALRTLLLDESTVTGKRRPLFGS